MAGKRTTATKKPRLAPPTAHQTIGPFFPAQFIKDGANDLAGLSNGRARAQGSPCVLFGRVSDAEDRPSVNAILEIWQANAAGR
ncbi:MAG: protocatechuate 3,4-dioxygenase subunit beta, partial [Alphaproteobacteria bacterium]|nr:protocatechuate 3,4-dioxygenase subunit beta [Alphaproteobacteria bacterium]